MCDDIPLENDQIDEIASVFKAMGDPTRLRILIALLETRRSVGELAGLVGMSDSAVSHQLRLLRNLRLVHAHKHGRTVTYCLDDEHIRSLLAQAVAHQQH